MMLISSLVGPHMKEGKPVVDGVLGVRSEKGWSLLGEPSTIGHQQAQRRGS